MGGIAERGEVWACELGLEVEGHTWSKIDKYLKLLIKYGLATNLSAGRDVEALHEHVAEGLLAVAVAGRSGARGTWVDVGSGGGFPGVLGAMLWEDGVVLVEPRSKRHSFLELVTHALELHAEVRRARLEKGRWTVLDGQGPMVDQFGVISARAVWSRREWLERAEMLGCRGARVLVHGRPGDEPLRVGPEMVAATSFQRFRVEAYVPRGTR